MLIAISALQNQVVIESYLDEAGRKRLCEMARCLNDSILTRKTTVIDYLVGLI